MNRELLFDGGLTVAYVVLIAWLLTTAPFAVGAVVSLVIAPLAWHFGDKTIREWKRVRDTMRLSEKNDLDWRYQLMRATKENIND